jgi:hypothetical protein
MLKVDDYQKEVRVVVRVIEIKICKGMCMHGTLVEPLLNPISGADI